MHPAERVREEPQVVGSRRPPEASPVNRHAELLDTLVAQQNAAAAAIEEYVAITNAKVSQFKTAVGEAKRAGASQAMSVDRVLVHRQELLTNERICCERYRDRMAESIAVVRGALARLQQGSDWIKE